MAARPGSKWAHRARHALQVFRLQLGDLAGVAENAAGGGAVEVVQTFRIAVVVVVHATVAVPADNLVWQLALIMGREEGRCSKGRGGGTSGFSEVGVWGGMGWDGWVGVCVWA